MKFLDCCCSRPRSRHHLEQNQSSLPSPGPPSRSPSPTHDTHNPAIIKPGQARDADMEKTPAEEPPAEEQEEYISITMTIADDEHFRPMLRRGKRYSAEALRKNGAVRLKNSAREPPTSARDICWVENNNNNIEREVMQENNNQNKRLTYTPAIPPPSWSRFPSHSRAERSCSSAGKEDHVYARDFAFGVLMGDLRGNGGDKAEGGEGNQGSWGRRYRRHTFEKSMARKLHRYHSTSLRPTRSGFRSSISMGGVLEYPELAILPSLEAIPLVSRADVAPPQLMLVDGEENPEPYSFGINNSRRSLRKSSHEAGAGLGPDRAAADGDSARAWSQIYEGCLLPRPTTSDETSLPKDSANANAFLRPEDGSPHSRQSSRQSSRQLSEHRRLSPRSSTEMRSSTVDFQRSLAEYEIRARERALQAASDASSRRTGAGELGR